MNEQRGNSDVFLSNGGKLGEIMRQYPWDEHPIGPPGHWPDALRSAVSICLASPFPIAIYWGAEHFLLYNDAYADIPGEKNPWAFGKQGSVAWSEIWHLIEQQFQDVLSKAESVHAPDSMLPMHRHGYTEECYFDYTLSPIYSTSGEVQGIFNAVIETSYKVINERRSELLYNLSTLAHRFARMSDARQQVLSGIPENNKDIPFAVLLSWSGSADAYQVMASSGLGEATVNVEAMKLISGINPGAPVTVDNLMAVIPALTGSNWPEPYTQAVYVALPYGNDHPDILLLGVNPGKRLDKDYERFLQTAAGHIGSAIRNAASTEADQLNFQRMQESKQELQFAINAAELGTWDLNPATMKFSGNARLKSWFGLNSAEEIELALALDVILESDRQRVTDAIAEATRKGSTGEYDIEYSIVHPQTREVRQVRATGKALFDPEGNATRFSGTLQDISTVRNARRDLEATNERLQIALDAADLGSYELDIETGGMICTDQCKANFGVTAGQEFDFSMLLAAIVPSMREQVRQEMMDAIQHRKNYHAEYEVVWPDQSRHWISAYGKPVDATHHRPAGLVGVTYEITAQVNDKRNLEKAYEQARLSKEAAQLGSFDLDLLAGTMEWDERCRILFGISHSGPVTYEKDFLFGLHPDDRVRIEENVKNVLIKEVSDGNYDVEYRTVAADNGQVRWVRAKGKAFFNEHNVPVRFIGSVLEITEQKETELRKNDFIGMVSHELKTPLTILKSYVQLLAQNAAKAGNQFETGALLKVDQQVNKMSRMINSFLNLARFESGRIHINKHPVLLNDIVEDVVSEISLIQSTHQISYTRGPEMMVSADREKISQVLHNLVSNAIKYSPKNTTVFIRCEPKGEYLKVSVRDEGIGIREEDMGQLFERFYRVDDPNAKHISGFGIGLYLSAQLIAGHGGSIWADSQKGNGSTFYFTLPVVY